MSTNFDAQISGLEAYEWCKENKFGYHRLKRIIFYYYNEMFVCHR